MPIECYLLHVKYTKMGVVMDANVVLREDWAKWLAAKIQTNSTLMVVSVQRIPYQKYKVLNEAIKSAV